MTPVKVHINIHFYHSQIVPTMPKLTFFASNWTLLKVTFFSDLVVYNKQILGQSLQAHRSMCQR